MSDKETRPKICVVCRRECHHEGRLCTCIPQEETQPIPPARLKRILAGQFAHIRNICNNSNPTFKVRVQQILAVINHIDETLIRLEIEGER